MDAVDDVEPGTRGKVCGIGEDSWVRGQREWFSCRIKVPMSVYALEVRK